MAESRIEDVIYDVKDYVKANIDTYLTGIEQTKEDGIALDDFRFCDVGERDIYSLQGPACMVYPESVTVTPLTMGADTIEIRLYFCIVIQGPKPDTMLAATPHRKPDMRGRRRRHG
jgi:hypothetical protein